MEYWAVSDLNASELQEMVAMLRTPSARHTEGEARKPS